MTPLLAGLLLAGVGALLLTTGGVRRRRGALEALATSILTGASAVSVGVVGWTSLVGRVHPDVGRWLLLAAGLAGGIAVATGRLRAVPGEESAPRAEPEPWTLLQAVGLAACVAFAAFACFSAASAPVHVFDPLFHFAAKGRLLYHEGVGGPAWTDLDGAVGRVLTHPAYPPGVGGLQAAVGWLSGGFDPDAARGLGGLFVVAPAVWLYRALRERGRGVALAGALVWLSTPLVFYFRLPADGALDAARGLLIGAGWGDPEAARAAGWRRPHGWALDGAGDLPLAALALGAFHHLRRVARDDADGADRVAGALLLAAAVLTKNEGAPLALLLAAALVVCPGGGVGRGAGARLRSLAPVLASAALLVAPWFAARGAIPVVDEGYGARLRPGALWAARDRLGEVLGALGESFVGVLSWNLLWPLLAAAVLFRLRRPASLARSDALPALLVVFGAVTLHAAVLLVTPWELERLFESAIPDRLLLHVAPLAVFAALALGWEREPAPADQNE
jgi:hypothetical protein